MSDSESDGGAAAEPDLETLARRAAEARLLRQLGGSGGGGRSSESDASDDLRGPGDVVCHDSPQEEMLAAAESGALERVDSLIQQDAALAHARDADGYTPLHRAAYNDHAQVAERLLAAGADVAARTGEGWTPLHSAARWNSVACLQLLLLHGADVNAVTDGGLTALMVAASSADARDACFLLLTTPGVRLELTNGSGDTAAAIARRSAAIEPLFEITEPYMTDI
ncbi:ankyrin repeat domain-containing protein 49-like isoform X3 [Pollicipes pollicipes]|uniref:ankyrin repeat domain-containing protein 49-like isoform X1 n=1 Tax=Pollicipes pollicipes TaxID=41117 RepID=UPI001884AB37|nr:ankyrin repeat domain-containing protein 49-like isoform X1 [Pollicipes pollicipes]XP_037093265.1 ankyrin repeat domain-containing protein 49-like isoform X2 [Pollicipes pollicipes]XP_037093266.1 ankyrin repeat domain-containing protein 49-like isoform X3 [Pollicipes pollicipes]XP_037093267.1 ankyrin repeat domain-containing protein 49-like isoform X3 [Pollicipes pollicipes]